MGIKFCSLAQGYLLVCNSARLNKATECVGTEMDPHVSI